MRGSHLATSMAPSLLEASGSVSANVGQGVLTTGHGTVTVGSIIYNNRNEHARQRRRTLKESLDFPERAQRERAIRNTHRDTGRWLLRTQQYLDWQPSEAPGLIHDDRVNADRPSDDGPRNHGTSNDRPSNDRPSNNKLSCDDEDDQETARCCGIFSKHKKTPRSALRSKRTVRWDPNPRSSVQTDLPAPASPLVPKKALRSALRSKRTMRRTPSPGIIAHRDWRQRLLWIKGNAGAGKSTLLKMVIDHDRITHDKALILPHFFNARGSELEHSTKGMYRTLICWLLEDQPKEFSDKLDPTGTRAAMQDWDVPELERLLNKAMDLIEHPSVVFYIDALDECDEAQVREMLEYFRNLVKTAWDTGREVRVCFASRPYPHITFNDTIFLDLSRQEEHIRDIEAYINDRLKIQESLAAADLRNKLLKKAAGVFMWAVLVIEMLNKACDQGRDEQLPQLLEEIPPGLHELYTFTLERYPEDRDATLVCFRWVLFGGPFMSPSRMWWAVQLGLGSGDEQIQRDYGRMSEDAMKRYIIGISKGIVEFREAPDTPFIYAQFVHESVRDFLFNEGAIQRMYGVQNRIDLAGQSHELLRDCLAAELVLRRPQLIEAANDRGENMPKLVDLERLGWTRDIKRARRAKFPLAWLASFAIWEQVEAAQRSGRDQKAYLDNALKPLGLYLLASEEQIAGMPSIFSDIITALLVVNCASVIRETQLESAQLARRAGQAFGLIDGRSKMSPLARAQRLGHESVQALVDVYLRLEPQHPDFKQLLRHLARPALDIPSHQDSDFGTADSWMYGPLLDLACADAKLGSFFVLALASPTVLFHLDALKQLAHFETNMALLFIQFQLYFVEHDLQTEALDYSCEDTLNWALESAKTLKEHNFWYSEEKKQAREERSEAISRLAALLRSKYHQLPGSST